MKLSSAVDEYRHKQQLAEEKSICEQDARLEWKALREECIHDEVFDGDEEAA